MLVHELIRLLEGCDQNATVILEHWLQGETVPDTIGQVTEDKVVDHGSYLTWFEHGWEIHHPEMVKPVVYLGPAMSHEKAHDAFQEQTRNDRNEAADAAAEKMRNTLGM